MIKKIYPKDITTDHEFMESPFENSECEAVLKNLVLLQQKANLNEWTPFSWDNYKFFCNNNVKDKEKKVLDVMAKGGEPARGASCLAPEWLDYNDGKYSFTDKMIEMLKSYV